MLRRVYRRDIALDLTDSPRLDLAEEAEVFRIAQEALTNIAPGFQYALSRPGKSARVRASAGMLGLGRWHSGGTR